MNYMILLYSDETGRPDFEPGSPQFQAMMGEWAAYNQSLVDSGHYIDGASLAASDTATLLTKNADGTETTTDGPYAESKEQLGGYYLISAESLDAALDIARRVPIPIGHFEVRPVDFRPDMS